MASDHVYWVFAEQRDSTATSSPSRDWLWLARGGASFRTKNAKAGFQQCQPHVRTLVSAKELFPTLVDRLLELRNGECFCVSRCSPHRLIEGQQLEKGLTMTVFGGNVQRILTMTIDDTTQLGILVEEVIDDLR